jgi:hypothetical protein
VRKLTLLLLLVCLAVSAWRTHPGTAQQTIGSCVEQRGREVRLVRCAGPPRPGFLSRGKVVGSTPQLIDVYPGELRFGPYCPPETDDTVPSPFLSRNPRLCVDTKPGDGNTPVRQEEFDRLR